TKSAPAQPHPTSDVRPPAPTPDAGLPVSASENSSRAASRRPSLVVRIDRLDGEIVYATAMQFLEHATQDEPTGQGGPRRRRSVDQIAAWLVSTYPSALGLRLARNSDAEKRAAIDAIRPKVYRIFREALDRGYLQPFPPEYLELSRLIHQRYLINEKHR